MKHCKIFSPKLLQLFAALPYLVNNKKMTTDINNSCSKKKKSRKIYFVCLLHIVYLLMNGKT